MKRYDLGTSRESGIGQPGITEQIDGAYVRHDDHRALMQEKDAEIAALERTVVDQTVVITELREAKCDGNHGSPRCAYPECWNDGAQPAEPVKVSDRLLCALERAGAAESALRDLVDECKNDSVAGWEARMESRIDHANHILAATPPADEQAVEALSYVKGLQDGVKAQQDADKVDAQPSVPADWENRIFTEMERRFGLSGQENQYERLRIDDTQIGVEFALDQMRGILACAPAQTEDDQLQPKPLHVGDSSFESWFSSQPFATQSGIKQISRDSYAAGMGDSLVAEQPDSTDAITYNPVYGTLLIGQHPSKGIVYVPLAAHLYPAMARDGLSDAEVVDLAVDHFGIDADRMPYNVVGFARAPLKRVHPARGEDSLTEEESARFLSTYGHFDDGVDTTTDEATLMKFARLGLLAAERFTVTQSGEAYYAAMQQERQP